MKTGELDELIGRLESELRQKQKDLDVAKRFRDAFPRLVSPEQAERSDAPSTAKQIPLVSENGAYGAVTDAVRAAIERCPVEYNIYDVETALNRHSLMDVERSLLSQVLHRLTKQGELHVREHGRGRRPTKFTKEELQHEVR